MSYELTVSVVSHGHGQMIATLLQDLARQTVAAQLEVIVTHNIPEEALVEIPGLSVRVVHNDAPKGFGANHNSAARLARGRGFCVLNPDIRIDDAVCLQRLLAARDARGDAMIAPRVMGPSGAQEDFIRSNLSPLAILRRGAISRSAGQRVLNAEGCSDQFFWIAGMFMLFETAAYRDLGGFDERFFMYCEDYDICARLSLSGRQYSVLMDCEVVHDAQRASRRSRQHRRWHLQSLVRVWLSLPFWRVALGGGR